MRTVMDDQRASRATAAISSTLKSSVSQTSAVSILLRSKCIYTRVLIYCNVYLEIYRPLRAQTLAPGLRLGCDSAVTWLLTKRLAEINLIHAF